MPEGLSAFQVHLANPNTLSWEDKMTKNFLIFIILAILLVSGGAGEHAQYRVDIDLNQPNVIKL